MSGAFGPILTTGVALSAAVVVVANPVTAPHADVRIPAAQAAHVSPAGGQAVDMLDEDFIKAVGPGPTVSTNPLAVLKDLVGALVADAAELGKNAVIHAFAVGASVVSRSEVPELTAASYPYVVPAAPESLPALPWPAMPGPVPEDLRPVVEQALTAIFADIGDVTDSAAVAAAFAAGAALAADQGPLLENLRGLVHNGLHPALRDAGAAVSALPRPAIGDVIRDAVDRYLPTAPAIPVLAGRDATLAAGPPATGATAVGATDSTEPDRRQPRPVAADRAPRPPTKAMSPKRPLSGLGPLGAAGINGAHRDGGAAAGGPIGRAVKAIAGRDRG